MKKDKRYLNEFEKFSEVAEKENMDIGLLNSKYGKRVKSKNGDILIIYPFLLDESNFLESVRGVVKLKKLAHG